MKLIISSVSGEPIYEQIKTQIRAAVLDGELKAGEALPSLRKLARELRISVLTVTRAYNELADEGVVQNIQGKGTFVMDKGNELMRRQLENQVRGALAEAVRAAEAAGVTEGELGEMLAEEYRRRQSRKGASS
ncbi:GntR family transcriptional regulator [Bifidobacterium platyrrhinorum]|uniref:GntR family transcriptional regulator n=1 Tax=Bifidobacterium platyrrhinorum TaxID=2661628 RepID=A0A6L9ST36_9BIFI|nr:GntR family transcriptional regulator [Bifidobacterium platyrrhinorum]NEG55740.1 GntR family transcriptional regulator [Bifidobacterium platyrrhinorum]